MKDQYKEFGGMYDVQMSPKEEKETYKNWHKIIKNELMKNKIRVRFVADLGCGTGNTTIPWVKKGRKVVGVDLSESMLKQARKKSKKVKWYKQDIAELKLKGKFDVITCMFDTLNHILEKKNVQKVFNKVYKTLDRKGMFFFDLNTEYALQWLGGKEKVFEYGKHLMISRPLYDKKKKIGTFRETWFMKKGKNYERKEIKIKEKAFRNSEIKKMLKKAGFKTVKIKVLTTRDKKPSRILFMVGK